jgi:hypothetical protein
MGCQRSVALALTSPQAAEMRVRHRLGRGGEVKLERHRLVQSGVRPLTTRSRQAVATISASARLARAPRDLHLVIFHRVNQRLDNLVENSPIALIHAKSVDSATALSTWGLRGSHRW